MMFYSSTCRLVILVSVACNAVTSAVSTVEPVVELGLAGEYAILAKSGISTMAGSYINGDIAVSPIASTAMTGFDLTLDSSTQFSKSALIVAGPDASLGEAYAASYGGEIANVLTTAVGAMETAYTDAAGRPRPSGDRINLGGGILGLGGNFGGPTKPLTPGVYTFGSDVYLNSDVQFSGDGVYIIQITGNLIQAAHKNVILDGAKSENIFWQVAGHVEVGVGAKMEGIILAKTKVDFMTGSFLNGRVLTQTACNLQSGVTINRNTEPVTTVAPINRRGLRSM
mmetsp:Transcript_4871/g.8433  ORF Transcript_4871/g.8433 Transcript_4871/m.8433 type:complete len:283 (+) Transcript_4871:228-1076(+)